VKPTGGDADLCMGLPGAGQPGDKNERRLWEGVQAVEETEPLIGDAPQLKLPTRCSEPGQKGGSFTALFAGGVRDVVYC
jgi:hypothetical protein